VQCNENEMPSKVVLNGESFEFRFLSTTWTEKRGEQWPRLKFKNHVESQLTSEWYLHPTAYLSGALNKPGKDLVADRSFACEFDRSRFGA